MGNFFGNQLGLQWYDFLRMLTSLLALTALYISGRRATNLWSKYTERLKQLWWVFNGLLLLLFEGSLEQIILDNRWGPRVLLSFILSLAAVRAVSVQEGYIKSERDLNA